MGAYVREIRGIFASLGFVLSLYWLLSVAVFFTVFLTWALYRFGLYVVLLGFLAKAAISIVGLVLFKWSRSVETI